MVYDGIYYENINFKGKSITVRSTHGAFSTIIDGSCNGSVVTFCNNENSFTKLKGFTIRNGLASLGGGIHCSDASPQITQCIIRNNTASEGGGGIYFYDYSYPILSDCIITGNTASVHGGGIYSDYHPSPTITNCFISRNRVHKYGGGIYLSFSPATIMNCVISNNTSSKWGGGVECTYSSSKITNCTISYNTASSDGGGIYYYGESTPKIINSILWGNSAGERFDEIYCDYPSSSITVTFSDIRWEYGVYKEIGNINSEPMFVNSAQGNLYLQAGSPCIDSGTFGNAPSEDGAEVPRPQGPGIDMGAYEHVDEISCFPRASFTATQTEGTDSMTVNFDASSSGGREYTGTSFFWDFGDDATDNGMIVSHTYSRYGSYDVSLTVTTECGVHNLTWYDLVKIKSSQVTKEIGEGYDYTSIQEAIDKAVYGDIILVHDGTYIENINFKGKVITVLSENGPAHTVITKKGGENTVEFNHAEGAYSVLEGFTIDEYPYQSGNGISCAFSSPQIINCNIKKIKRRGIDCRFSSPQIINCTITGNNRSGIYSHFSSPQIINCTISENRRSGIFSLGSSLTISNCVITGNTTPDLGSGIYCEDSQPTIINSMLQDNQAEGSANAVYLLESVPIVSDYSDMQLVNYGKDLLHMSGFKLFLNKRNTMKK